MEKLIKSEQNDQYMIDDIKQFYLNLQDELSITKLESEINFNRRECEASLYIDLEYGRCQKEEQLQFYEQNSVNMSMF